MTPTKRALARQTESPSSAKKRKQSTTDDYASTVCILTKIYAMYSFFLVHVSFCSLTEAAYAIVVGEEEKIRTYDLNCKGEVGF
jgi:hypothetical protein